MASKPVNSVEQGMYSNIILCNAFNHPLQGVLHPRVMHDVSKLNGYQSPTVLYLVNNIYAIILDTSNKASKILCPWGILIKYVLI